MVVVLALVTGGMTYKWRQAEKRLDRAERYLAGSYNGWRVVCLAIESYAEQDALGRARETLASLCVPADQSTQVIEMLRAGNSAGAAKLIGTAIRARSLPVLVGDSAVEDDALYPAGYR